MTKLTPYEDNFLMKLMQLGIRNLNLNYPDLNSIRMFDYEFCWHPLESKYEFVRRPFKTSSLMLLRENLDCENTPESKLFIISPFLLKFLYQEITDKKKPVTSIINQAVFGNRYDKDRFHDFFYFYRTLEQAYSKVEFYYNSSIADQKELLPLLNMQYNNTFSIAIELYRATRM